MSVARFSAAEDQLPVPHTICSALLGVSLAWFYKWIARAQGPDGATGLHTDRDRRRDALDRAVVAAFTDAKGLHGHRGCMPTCGMPVGRCRRRRWPIRCAAKCWWPGGSNAAMD